MLTNALGPIVSITELYDIELIFDPIRTMVFGERLSQGKGVPSPPPPSLFLCLYIYGVEIWHTVKNVQNPPWKAILHMIWLTMASVWRHI